jgi:TfoX/Sxy family transcriptional regulator of competence genes
MAYDLGLSDRIRVVLSRLGEFSERKMFGSQCFLVNGRMCCGIVKSDLMLRLTGKPMRSMIFVEPVRIPGHVNKSSGVM